jgi:hypothetical protein
MLKPYSKLIQVSLIVVALLSSHCKLTGQNSNGQEGFVQIFDGKTLKNWEGDPTYWRVENGHIVGEVTPSTPLKTNTFLIWRGGETKDFELKVSCRITASGNTGINYRSEQVPDVPYALRGYQADIDGRNNYTGQNYEERGRTTLAYRGQKVVVRSQANPGDPNSLRANVKSNAWTQVDKVGNLGSSDSLKTLIKSEDWNEVHLVVQGNRLRHYVNGVLMSDVTDNDTVNRKMNGLLGVQVHVGPPMKVEYRSISYKQL